jgi:membrane-associated phospholipid phosphatase
MNRNNLLLSGPLILLAVLVAASVPVHIYNRQLFSLLNDFHSPFSDVVWLVLTALGDGLVLGIVVGAFIVWNPRVVAVGIPLLLLSSLAVNATKAIFPTLRPATVLDAVHVVGPLLRSGSFPSGHAAAAFAAGLAVAYGSGSRFTATGALLLAASIGISRIFVGAHFPDDVIAGMICPLALFAIFDVTVRTSLEQHIPNRPFILSPVFRLLLGMEILAIVMLVFLYGPYFSQSPTVCAVVGGAALVFVAIGWRLRCRTLMRSH